MNYDYVHYGTKRKNGNFNRREKQRKAKLTVCIGIFAFSVVLKLAAPDLFADIGEKMESKLEHSVDYRAVFAALGNFVSGESTLGDTIAVIKSSTEKTEAAVAAMREVTGGAAENYLKEMHIQYLAAEALRAAKMEKTETETAQQEVPELPENVCMEAVKLPFDYTRPIAGRITSGFGYRQHPVDDENRFHYGTDFAADEGENISAFAAGYVAASGISETAGKYLIISHGNGWITQYFHCSEVYATGGTRVECGQTVAAAGQTGNATGPHLHMELICDGVYYNPGLYLSGED